MKIEVHSRMNEQPQAGNQGARMIGKAPRIALYVEDLPSHPKKRDQKDKAAKPADRARFGKSLCVIIVTVVYDETIVGRFVKWEDFLQSAQARSQDPVILKNKQSVMQHFHPAPLAGLQFLIAGESVQCGANSQPRNQNGSQG